MTDQPNNTSVFNVNPEELDERGYGLLAAAAQQAVLPRQLDEGVYAILNPNGGIDVVETDGYRIQREHDWERTRADTVEFVHRQVTLLNVPSFIDYLARNTREEPNDVGEDYLYCSGGLELWADIDARKVTAVLDGMDGLRKHTATLALKTSREWGEWIGIDGKLMPQVEFAQFIQDHISTIGEPAGALLVDICETLVGSTDVQWKSQQLDRSGQRKFVYEEVVNGQAGAKGDLSIPTELTLVLRPFQGSEQLLITARFRFRLAGGAVQLGVKLVEPERVLEDAFNQVVDEVQDQVPVHVNHGRP